MYKLENFESIRVDSLNWNSFSDDHFLVNKDMSRLVFMFDMNLVCGIVPKHVQVLCRRCFYQREQVKSISFEDDSELHRIEYEAFKGTSIERFVVPRLVSEIEYGAFSGCDELKDLLFDDDCVLTSLRGGIFEGLELKCLFISCHVYDIESGILSGISRIEISANNPHINSDSPEFLRARGISHLGNVVDDHSYLIAHANPSAPREEFQNAELLDSVFLDDEPMLTRRSNFDKPKVDSIHPPSFCEIDDSSFRGCKQVSTLFVGWSIIPSWILKSASLNTSSLGFVFLPSEIREIPPGCFAQSSLSRIEFSEDSCLEVIGAEAFAECKIRTLCLPKSVQSLGDCAFARSRKLKTFLFEEGSNLEIISYHCFKGTCIDTLTLPPKVCTTGCGSLSGINNVVIDVRNQNIIRDGSFLLSPDKHKFCGVLAGLHVLHIPNFVWSLEKRSLMNSKVRYVWIPKSVALIYKEVFCHCEHLREVKFECGSRICEIGRRCFAECKELSCISFANCWRLRVFSDGMFQRTSLKSIAIPCSVREIGFNCFSGCSQLSRIDFDKSSRLKRICDEAFKGCAIVSLEFPSSVV